MNDDTYNGWANRETWAAALYLGNDQGLYNGAREAVAGLHYYEPTEALDMTCKVCGVDLMTGKHGARPDDAIKEYTESLLKERYTTGEDGDVVNVPLMMMFDDIGSLWRVDWRAVAEAFSDDT